MAYASELDMDVRCLDPIHREHASKANSASPTASRTPETASTLGENLDLIRGIDAFLNAYQALRSSKRI